MYACVCVCVCVCVFMYVCMYACMHVCVYVCMYMYAFVYMCACTRICDVCTVNVWMMYVHMYGFFRLAVVS